MQQSNKVYALTQNFMNQLYDEWVERFSDTSISEYLEYIHLEYKTISEKQIVKGDTGIYFDIDIVSKINKDLSHSDKNILQSDLACSKLLFGTSDTNLGLYRINERGSKVPINFVNATDPRIWNYLSLFVLRDYTNARWGQSKDSKRIFLTRISNERISRHSVSRLFWSAQLCHNSTKSNGLELLSILWHSEDFMTQVTERSTSSNKVQLQWFLELCNEPQYKSKVFSKNSMNGQYNYRSLLKLFVADELVSDLGMMDRDQFEELFIMNLKHVSSTDLL
jgi:hypothetical protein